MVIPRKVSGTLAILAAIIALLLSPPFAAAFFRAYPGFEIPPAWVSEMGSVFKSLLDFAPSRDVYQIYGRYYSVVIPLTVPAMISLRKDLIGEDDRLERGWRVFFAGVLILGLGIIGDYWPNQDSFWVGLGFTLELIGTLLLWGGAIYYGIQVRRNFFPQNWTGIALFGIPVIGMLGMGLLAHIPSGPLFGYVLFWLVQGYRNIIYGRN